MLRRETVVHKGWESRELSCQLFCDSEVFNPMLIEQEQYVFYNNGQVLSTRGRCGCDFCNIVIFTNPLMSLYFRAEDISKILHSLTTVPRFSMAVMFLSSSNKRGMYSSDYDYSYQEIECLSNCECLQQIFCYII